MLLVALLLAVLPSNDKSKVDPEVTRAHAVLTRQVGHMTRLVDDLLDVSRITRGAIELRWEVVDLRDVVKSGIETTTPVFHARRHETQVSLPDQPLWVRGDATRLGQVIGNLLHNAAKYTAAGGRIELCARREGEFAVLATQCLDRRLPDVETLRREVAAWQVPRHESNTKINWRFGTDEARVKLHRLYPPAGSLGGVLS